MWELWFGIYEVEDKKLWFGMEIKIGFGIYEVENKEYGVWVLGFRILGI